MIDDPTGPATELGVAGSDCCQAAVFALLSCPRLSASPGFVTFQRSVLGQSCSHLKPENNDQMEPEFIRAAEECQVSASAVQNELWDADGWQNYGGFRVYFAIRVQLFDLWINCVRSVILIPIVFPVSILILHAH